MSLRGNDHSRSHSFTEDGSGTDALLAPFTGIIFGVVLTGGISNVFLDRGSSCGHPTSTGGCLSVCWFLTSPWGRISPATEPCGSAVVVWLSCVECCHISLVAGVGVFFWPLWSDIHPLFGPYVFFIICLFLFHVTFPVDQRHPLERV